MALTGTAVAATALENDSVRSRHIVNGAVKKKDLAAKVRQSFAPKKHRHDVRYARKAHTHDPRYVNEGQANSVGPAMISNTRRSIQIPLGAFVDCEGQQPINWVSGADTRPDYLAVGSSYVLRFDDAAGNLDMNHTICTEFVAPPDGLNTVAIRVVAGKDGETAGADERILARLGELEADAAQLDGAGLARYQLPAGIGLSSGARVGIELQVNANGPDINDAVDLHAVDVLYDATQ